MATKVREKTRTPGVYKIVYERKTTYEARWRAKNPETGKRQQFSAPFAKLEDAEAHLDHVRQARRNGTFVVPSMGKRTFGAVFDGWLDAKARKANTLNDYRSVYHAWLQPWHDEPVGGITYDDVRTLMKRVKDEGRANATIRRVFVLLNGTMEEAVREGCIAVNPAARYRRNLPSPRRGTKPHPIAAGQVTALADAVHAKALAKEQAARTAQRYRLVVLTGAWTGLRAGELCGLRVRDVHVLNAEVQVVQTVYPCKGGGWRIDTPKSEESADRLVPIPPALAKELLAFARECGLGPDDLVFGVDGTPFQYKNFVRRYFKPSAKECGLPIRFHDLRHTFAALKLNQGYRLDQLKVWMGHYSIKVTVDLYGTLVPEDEDARRSADDAAFLAAAPTATVVPLRPVSAG